MMTAAILMSATFATATPTPPALQGDVALVVSGGVSLGTYQAGFLFYLSEYLKRVKAKPVNLVVATGASAGSVNATLAALAMCATSTKARLDPKDSLLYQTWHGITIEGLYPHDGRSTDTFSMFDRAPLVAAAQRVGREVRATGKWLPHCRTDLGFVATRLQARNVNISGSGPSLAAKRMSEKFVLTLDITDAPGRVRFKHLNDEQEKTGLWLHPGSREIEPKYADLSDVLLASAAFPGAFPPVSITYFDHENAGASSQFIDGGVFENVPVRLARDLLQVRRHTTRPIDFIVLSTEVTPWSGSGALAAEHPTSVVDLVEQFAADFISASRSTEIVTTVRRADMQRKRGAAQDTSSLFMPRRRPALSSDHLLAFSGFLDERFRRLDFYLGMADARDFLRSTQAWQKVRNSTTTIAALDTAIDDPTFRCIRKIDDGKSHGFKYPFTLQDARALCRADFADSADLLQVLIANVATREHVAKKKIAHDSSEAFKFYLNELEKGGFVFRPYAGGQIIRPNNMPTWIRRNMDLVLGRWSSAQPSFSSDFLVSTAGRLALNDVVEFSEPPAVLGIGLHANRGMDLSWGTGFGPHLQHRFALNARARKLNLLGCNPLCLSAFGSLEYRWAFGYLFSEWFGLEAGAEAGFGHVWKLPEEDEDDTDQRKRFAAWLFGGSLTATLMQRVYLRVDLQYTPKYDFGSPENNELLFGLGLGFRFHDARVF